MDNQEYHWFLFGMAHTDKTGLTIYSNYTANYTKKRVTIEDMREVTASALIKASIIQNVSYLGYMTYGEFCGI